MVNGVAQAAGTVIDINAAQLAQTSFVTGTVGDNLQIRAYDGTDWSAADNAAWSAANAACAAANAACAAANAAAYAAAYAVRITAGGAQEAKLTEMLLQLGGGSK